MHVLHVGFADGGFLPLHAPESPVRRPGRIVGREGGAQPHGKRLTRAWGASAPVDPGPPASPRRASRHHHLQTAFPAGVEVRPAERPPLNRLCRKAFQPSRLQTVDYGRPPSSAAIPARCSRSTTTTACPRGTGCGLRAFTCGRPGNRNRPKGRSARCVRGDRASCLALVVLGWTLR